MNPAIRRTLSAFLGIFLFASAIQGLCAQEATQKEARGIWLHLTDFSDDPVEGKKQVRETIDKFAKANFNLVMPWVLSEYVAALSDTNYLPQATTAKWDSLGEVVRESHARGMQIHIWYSFTYYKSPKSPEFDPKHGGDPNWAALSLTSFQNKTNTMTDVCPLHPKAREWELKLIETMLNRYTNVSGIHIEEPGFGYPQSCVCDLCRSTFKNIYGRDLETMIDSSRAEDFRTLGTTEFIRDLRERLNARKPRVILSVNGGPLWRNDRTLGRDWKRWAELGWLDYYASQNYTPDLGTFQSYTQTVLNDIQPHCPVFIGIGVKWSGGGTPLPAVLKEIEDARARGSKGILFFSANGMTDDYLSALRDGPFAKPAAYPGTGVSR